MERTMSVEERIRRAEERYNRKNQNEFNKNESIYKNINSKKSNIKKMFMQMFICLLIYILFYVATNSEYIFSDNFKNDVSIFFSEKMNVYTKYLNIKDHFNENNSINNEDEKEENKETKDVDKEELNSEEKNKDENNLTNNNEEKKENKEGEGLGGAKEEKDNTKKENELTQMQKDAEKIKSTISFIKPIDGVITSTYGWRNPSNKKIPKNHTGIDIAAVQGTKIKSATDGKIILASSKGDFGNHYKIQCKDIIIIYAHCKKLYFKEGVTVKQGQEIAEVGSTGNSTGPHLHFEIRIEDRKVDPQLIMEL